MSRVWTRSDPMAGDTESLLRVYTGTRLPLREEDREFFADRYELNEPFGLTGLIQRSVSGRYLLPIWDTKGLIRGIVARIPWEGAPQWTSEPAIGTKAITYRHLWGPVQSHYAGSYDGSGSLVLVEDQLSAIKLASRGWDSVALLGTPADVVGTYGGSDRVAEIATRARTHDEVIIALDADATDASFRFVRKWGSAFRQIRIAILSRDIKDTPANQLAEVLGI